MSVPGALLPPLLCEPSLSTGRRWVQRRAEAEEQKSEAPHEEAATRRTLAR